MRFKLTALLLLLNIALFGYILFLQSGSGTARLFDQQNTRLLQPDFATSFEQIRLAGPDLEQTWEFHQDPLQPDSWLVQQPLPWKANPFAIDQLRFQLARLNWESSFPVDSLADSNQSLADYGLKDPRRTLTLTKKDQSVVLRIGNPTGIGRRFYLLSPDSQSVLVADRPLFDLLTADPERFYDPSPFSLNLEQIQALQIQDQVSSNVRVRLVRENQNWRFVSPIEAPADNERVQALLQQWIQSEVTQRLPLPEAPASFSGNTLRLTIEGPASRQTLLFAPANDDPGIFYAAREAWPTAFTVPADRVQLLRSAQADLREKRFLRFLANQWNSLEVSMDDASVTLQELESGQWQVLFTDPQDQLQSLPADPKVIRELNQFMELTEAVRFVTDVPSESDRTRFGLDDPQRRVLFRRPDQPAVEFIVGGIHPEENLLYATTNASGSVFLVRPHILSLFPPDPYHYRDRSFWQIPDQHALREVRLIHLPSGIDAFPEQSAKHQNALRKELQSIRVQQFLRQPFTKPLQLDEDLSLPWQYQLEVDTAPANDPQANPTRHRFLLTPSLGSSLQYLADPTSERVAIPQNSFLQALRPFILRFPQPPASPTSTSDPPTPDPAP